MALVTKPELIDYYYRLIIRQDVDNWVRWNNLIDTLYATGGSGSTPGPYANDAAAAIGGVAVDGLYTLSEINDYDIPSPGGRTVVKRLA